ncbi:transcriptional regulator domain-containing protein [Pandoraea pnomenusa]|uniref:transcriptional regulator domain-containing protein n=1 Tax=Pandoraea pnomenusa TaxID=93220 RepID=UPI000AAE06DB|nr:DUF6499 domain-containing protein [Pandoraea pnomenusa]
MMARECVPEEFRLFIARADWRDPDAYPRDTLHDPSVWAWEFLRRNNSYAQDYADLHSRVHDVPTIPFPKMSLEGYVCDPEPSQGVTYEKYKSAHPRHKALPVRDYIRERWGIIRLVDPSLSAAEVEKLHPGDDPRNRLAWMFASATPEIVNSPTTWPSKNYLAYRSVASVVAGYCTGTEVMVRLDFTGNFDVQMDSLRRSIGSLFEGGTRSGARINDSREQFREQIAQTLGASVDAKQEEFFEEFIAVKPSWNEVPAKFKTLQSTARMVDVIASLEAGTLETELEAKWEKKHPAISVRDIDISINSHLAPSRLHYVCEHGRVRAPLCKALFRYFNLHGLEGTTLVPGYIDRCLDNAYRFSGGEHALVARMSPPDPKKKRKA